ncbi:MAG: Com family DNA-binding transcriptional regulator [Ramlibacter sp.]|nr:Com family DNA-binding transcriptional regulator [Ramlibacter sp.]
MDEIRCGRCSKKLAAGEYVKLQIKCPRCGALNEFLRVESPTPARLERQGKDAHDDGEARPQGPR